MLLLKASKVLVTTVGSESRKNWPFEIISSGKLLNNFYNDMVRTAWLS
jgi:hypothetical protein